MANSSIDVWFLGGMSLRSRASVWFNSKGVVGSAVVVKDLVFSRYVRKVVNNLMYVCDIDGPPYVSQIKLEHRLYLGAHCSQRTSLLADLQPKLLGFFQEIYVLGQKGVPDR